MKMRALGRRSVVAAIGLLGAAVVILPPVIDRGLNSAVAAPPAANPPAAAQPATPPSDYSQRVVAYIYGTIPITREDLGEYLIARHGLDNVETLVNKKIIERACEKAGITVTDAEVEAAILADCATIGVNQAQFVQTVVKQNFGKSLYEWKEDIIKPRLLLTKLCKDKITVSEDDLKKAFEAAYGEKRDCRIIIWPKGEQNIAMKEYDDVRKSEGGFDRKARTQANGALAATQGKIRPIAHYSGAHKEVEKAAFTLRPGEVSGLIGTEEGFVVLKVVGTVPPDATVKFEDKREALRKEVFEKKVSAEIPALFKKMHDEAKPVFILKKNDPMATEKELDQQIKPAGGTAPAKPK
jgi:hypothetical protein